MPNVTGRDGYIHQKALFYAAHFIDGVPDTHRADINHLDMRKLLRAGFGKHGFEAWMRHFGPMLEEITGRPFNDDGPTDEEDDE